MSKENDRVRIGATSNGGVYCECRESFFVKALCYGTLTLAGACGLIGVIEAGVKKFDRWLNGDGKDTKGISTGTNKQPSTQESIEKKEEPLTDFSKPITKYDSKSAGAEAYRRLAKEVMKKK